MLYAEWRACERFGIKPPGIADSWDKLTPIRKCELMSYDQIREIEDTKKQSDMLAAMFGASGS